MPAPQRSVYSTPYRNENPSTLQPIETPVNIHPSQPAIHHLDSIFLNLYSDYIPCNIHCKPLGPETYRHHSTAADGIFHKASLMRQKCRKLFSPPASDRFQKTGAGPHWDPAPALYHFNPWPRTFCSPVFF